MKILFLATQLPLPPDTGGKIRSFNILRHLAQEHELTFVCALDPTTDERVLRQMHDVCPQFVAVAQKQWDRQSWRYFVKLLCNFASPYPFSVAKDSSPALVQKIRQLLAAQRFDVLVCDFLHASINLHGINGLPRILFQHNVEAEIFRRYYLRQTNPLLRAFWRHQWKKMQRYERRVAQELDCCIAVSEKDKLTLQKDYQLTNVATIGTGVDVKYFGVSNRARLPNRLVFTGSMDWLPNEDAMIWFVHEILPSIEPIIPDVSLTIVGRRPRKRVFKLCQRNPRVMVTGRVEDVRPFLAEGSVFVVPLRIAGGTRIKIFEAMASGIPVVSTTIGAEGLAVEHGRHILLADSPTSFAESVIRLLQSPALARELAHSAKTLVAENNDWRVVSQEFADICRETIQQAARSRKPVEG
jgi:polysaccharide biosynthesis protein PslH